MSKAYLNLEFDLRISTKPVIAIVIVYAAALFFSSVAPSDLAEQARVAFVAILLFALSAAAWALDGRRPRISRWLTVALFTAVVYSAVGWLGVDGFLILAAIPVALAAALVGLLASGVAALAGTGLTLLVPSLTGANVDPAAVSAALVSLWGTFAVMCAVYLPVSRVGQWAWTYYQEGLRLQQEAQQRKAELAQALEGLAQANRQLALANERMTALRTVAEEARKAKTAFVAKVSHEFRTPLNMITGLVDIMMEAPELYAVTLSPRMREDLEVVNRNCEHLLNMVNDVLDLTRVESGRLVLHKERVDLHELVERAVAAVAPLLERKQLSLQVAVPENLPEVYCDRTRVQQVILNLVSNAARFTEEGGVTVDVRREDQQVIVRVTDTGPGIPQEDIGRIFEPFSQGSGEQWCDKGGSGLGLSISRQFVRLHGGRMWLESQVGAGSSFVFTLPISPPMEHIGRPGHQLRRDWIWREPAFRSAQTGYTEEMMKPRVVVCDEAGALRAELASHSDEIELVDCRDLTEAMEDLQECPAHVLILNETDPDGVWPLVEAARQGAPTTPIIGCSVSRPTERAVQAGALGYLIKPVTRADLEEAIRAVGKPVRSVLVVDDDPEVLRLFSQMLWLCDSALEVVTASSSQEALGKLRQMRADLVLLDVVMPGLDGWRMLESMREGEGIGDVPIFFVSAQDPVDRPPVSHFLLATMGEGLTLDRLLSCSLEMSALLLKPEEGSDLEPE